MTRRGSLESRVARIEAQLAEPPASDLPLSCHEQRELAELEHERRERFSKLPWPGLRPQRTPRSNSAGLRRYRNHLGPTADFSKTAAHSIKLAVAGQR